MPSDREHAEAQARRNAQRVAKTAGRFEVATISPFTVYLDGSTKAVPANKLLGLSYSVGTTGEYTLRQGNIPLCFPIA